MSLSVACEKWDHDFCLRRSCSCFCGHPNRLSDEDRARLEARPAPSTQPLARIGADPSTNGFASRESNRPRRTTPRAPRTTRVPRPPVERPPGFLERLATAYNDGATLRELAVEHRVSTDTIRKDLIGFGVTMRRPGGNGLRTDIDNDELARRYQAGENLRALAAAYRCAVETARDRLRAVGVELRPGHAHGGLALPIEDIADAYASGWKLAELAERYSCSSQTIRNRLAEAGVTIRPKAWKPLPEADIVAAYEAGDSAKTIGEAVGADEGTVLAHLRVAGVTIRDAGPERPNVDVATIWHEYQAGASTETIATRHGCSPQTVIRRLREAGHELRPVGAKPNGSSKRVDVPVAEVARRYRLGWSLEDLGIEYGVAWNTIRARLDEAGVAIRPMGTRGRRQSINA